MDKNLKDVWTKGVNQVYCDIPGAPAQVKSYQGFKDLPNTHSGDMMNH